VHPLAALLRKLQLGKLPGEVISMPKKCSAIVAAWAPLVLVIARSLAISSGIPVSLFTPAP
jgi:hypothetical protein